jgi:hypothetical protein
VRHLLRGGAEPGGRVGQPRDELAQLAGHRREGGAEDVALRARLWLHGESPRAMRPAASAASRR